MTNNTAALRLHNEFSTARNEVIERCLPLVKSITARLRLSHGRGASFDDLYEIGIDGLMQAADRFDPARGASFTTFAYYRIRGAILDSLRRGPLRPSIGVAQAEASVAVETLGHVMAANDNGRFDGRSEPPKRNLIWQLCEPVLAHQVPLEDINALADDSAPHPDEELERQRLAERVVAAISTLPEMERRVVELHYYEELSFAEIGKKLGICKPWAFRLHNKALRQLRERLAELSDDDGETTANA